MKLKRSALIAFLLTMTVTGVISQTNLDLVAARDELRWGVTAYHDGNFNEAIVSLNRSLAFDSSQEIARFWLGRAYYSAGFEEAALAEWEWLIERGSASPVLAGWIERVKLERGLTEERLGSELTPGRLVTMAEVPGIQGDLRVFRRPAMVRPRSDGYFYVASFATHQVLLMDPNGVRKKIIDGGLEGFDQPFDMVILESGELLVSEFGADRIARINGDGFKIGSFGSTGRGEGEFLGPQYLASDESGFVYVSDYGNRRIAKYTSSGEFILSFGGRSPDFQGLREPTGLAWHQGRVYVSDVDLGAVAVFDESGNHLGLIGRGDLVQPEALSVYREGILLVADRNRLLAFQLATGDTTMLAELAPRHQLIGAVVDANRNVIVSDFQSDLLLFMSPSEELYTGLTVELEHVIAAEHPRVITAVHVTDRRGNPVLGLDTANFRVTEDRFPTGQAAVRLAGYQTSNVAVAVIVSRSRGLVNTPDAVRDAALDLADSIAGRGDRWLVTAGEQPLVESVPSDGRLAFADAAVGSPADYGDSALDLAVRLAGRQIVRSLNRRSIVYVTDGRGLELAFENYGLVETGEFMRNNHIQFTTIYTELQTSTPELEYLSDITGGESVYLYQPAGLGESIDRLVESPSGTYLLEYTSVHDTDFGRRYIPLEVEAYLLRRSGRDASGYYGPLEF